MESEVLDTITYWLLFNIAGSLIHVVVFLFLAQIAFKDAAHIFVKDGSIPIFSMTLVFSSLSDFFSKEKGFHGPEGAFIIMLIIFLSIASGVILKTQYATTPNNNVNVSEKRLASLLLGSILLSFSLIVLPGLK